MASLHSLLQLFYEHIKRRCLILAKAENSTESKRTSATFEASANNIERKIVGKRNFSVLRCLPSMLRGRIIHAYTHAFKLIKAIENKK